MFSLGLIVKQANWAAIASEAKLKFLKESLFLRSSTLVHMEDMTYTKRLVVNHLNSSSSAAGDEEERSTSSISCIERPYVLGKNKKLIKQIKLI